MSARGSARRATALLVPATTARLVLEPGARSTPAIRAPGCAIPRCTRTRSTRRLSFVVIAKHQRRAYGREAVAALCAHLTAAGIEAIRAEIDVRHRASIALVEAVGFERADPYRSADLIGGLRGYDHLYVLRAPRAPALAAPNPSA